ncbi:ABC transporter permease subunit [Neolewinella lacunae]|uniref:ABC transporter permease subunit n=1 Tax=Neolewinella lacunae TaxID=1517758 RepID=A0A923PMG0_9BACT|nr:ABC transporter permease subunit [Neolewinella lacunae]MBC6995135.1 ABC transporter permease subunit [Neolewinella lacunae]MDN3634085.1 ABC transporter permease subunit [Neolewinella lacunae]
MYFLQLKFELRRLARSPLTWLLLLCLLVFFGFSFYSSSQHLHRKAESVNAMLEAQQKELTAQSLLADSLRRGTAEVAGWWQDPTNPIVVGGIWRGGRVVVVPPQPNNYLALGMQDLRPDAWLLRMTGKQARGDVEFENPVNLSFGAFDLAFVIAFLLPLLVIALSFDLISAERELGTLPMLRAQPVMGRKLFFAKALARFSLLAAAALLALLPFFLLAGVSPFSAAGLGTVVLVLLSLLLWFLVALGINLLGGNSAVNALQCVGAWLIIALLLPVLANMLSEKLSPIPSRAAFLNSERATDKYLEESREDRLSAFYQQHPNYERKSEEEQDWRDYYRELLGLMPQEDAIRDSINRPFDEQIAAQEALSEKLLWLSPSLSIYAQLGVLAGTDREAGQSLEAEAEQLRQRWSGWFTDLFMEEKAVDASAYAAIAAFPSTVETEPPSPSYRGVLGLLLQCLLAGAWCFWVAQRRMVQ